MKSFLTASLLLVMLFSVGCTSVNRTVTFPSMPTITSTTYSQQVAPLLHVIVLAYGPQLKPQEQAMLNNIVASLDKQAQTQNEVNVLPAIITAATPILLQRGALTSIKPQDAALALAGLEVLSQTYTANQYKSDILETLYPIIREGLKARLAAAK